MYLGIFLTLITGLFFLIGIFILQKVKQKEKFSLFITSLAFIILSGLLIFDLLPEIIDTKNIFFLVPIIIGFLILVILDKLIPHHNHNHKEENDDEKDHELHLNHIGIVTIIALAIHNMIEGLALYNMTLNSIKSGILMMVSISLHNIPLGFQIGNSLKLKKNGNILILFLCLSAFLGALIIILFGTLSEFLINILLSLTFGMLLYLLMFELFREIKRYFKKKEVIYGIILGIVILIITLFI